MPPFVAPGPEAFETTGRRLLIPLACAVFAVMALAFGRHLIIGSPTPAYARGLLLAFHLATVIPAVPLGAYLIARRKGDRVHRLLGRIWAGLMFTTALASFGLHSLNGGFSPIHLLSILVVVTAVRGVWQAMRGDIARHRRSMVLLYAGLLGAAVFLFMPGRLFGVWLFG